MNEPRRAVSESDSVPLTASPSSTGAVPVLRRRAQPMQALPLASTAAQVVTAIDCVQSEGKSEALLLCPQRPDSIAVFHALAALSRVENCDTRTLQTIFF